MSTKSESLLYNQSSNTTIGYEHTGFWHKNILVGPSRRLRTFIHLSDGLDESIRSGVEVRQQSEQVVQYKHGADEAVASVAEPRQGSEKKEKGTGCEESKDIAGRTRGEKAFGSSQSSDTRIYGGDASPRGQGNSRSNVPCWNQIGADRNGCHQPGLHYWENRTSLQRAKKETAGNPTVKHMHISEMDLDNDTLKTLEVIGSDLFGSELTRTGGPMESARAILKYLEE